MTKSAGRIGKVKFKDTGHEIVFHDFAHTKTHCHESVRNLGDFIDENTQAVGFFILKKNGAAVSGFSYEGGTALAEMIGGAECLKMDLVDHWQTPEEDYDGAG